MNKFNFTYQNKLYSANYDDIPFPNRIEFHVTINDKELLKPVNMVIVTYQKDKKEFEWGFPPIENGRLISNAIAIALKNHWYRDMI